MTVTLTGPDDVTVARVIAAVLDCRAPTGIPAGVAAGLDLPDLVAAIRHGSTAARCVERLVAASASRSVVDAAVDSGAAPPRPSRLRRGDGVVHRPRRGTRCVASRPRRRSRRRRGWCLPGRPALEKRPWRVLGENLQVPLIATSVASWFADSPGHLDSVIKAVNAVFERARALAPCVVLLDELDALPNRATMDSRGRDWWLPVITHFLLTLDSAVSGATRGLIIVGATNHAEALDAALVRPGRLERVIEVLPPRDAADRAAILRWPHRPRPAGRRRPDDRRGR